MIFVRDLVAVSVRWCKVYAQKQKWLRLIFIGTNGIVTPSNNIHTNSR